MANIEDYTPIIGQGAIEELFLLAKKFEGKTLLNINSTAVGGGVAEILTRMIPLQKQLGVDARWDVIKGDERFFVITKNMHNALHGVDANISDDDFAYLDRKSTRLNSSHIQKSRMPSSA